MHSVDILAEAITLAEKNDFEVRQEYLGGSTGGACRIAGRWILFVDLSLPIDEQLTQTIAALRSSRVIDSRHANSQTLQRLLGGCSNS